MHVTEKKQCIYTNRTKNSGSKTLSYIIIYLAIHIQYILLQVLVIYKYVCMYNYKYVCMRVCVVCARVLCAHVCCVRTCVVCARVCVYQHLPLCIFHV